jgi:hypothetical protein
MTAATALRLGAIPAAADFGSARWVLQDAPPPEWGTLLASCCGGFFHTPAGIGFSVRDGQPFYARLYVDRRVVGIAAGVGRTCRLAWRPAHVYLPTLPALIPTVPREPALDLLVATLARGGTAEITMDSYDATWRVPSPAGSVTLPARQEYRVDLMPSRDVRLSRLSDHHRRRLPRTEREGTMLRVLEGKAARDLLREVQRAAATRAISRGAPFVPALPPERVEQAPGESWGTTTFSAWQGDTPLAAAHVGWSHGRAYYLIGGSTAAGYANSAAVWLHWVIMEQFADRGFTAYSLGGAPASAHDQSDPAFGLHRFKMGFGPTIMPCQGLRWRFGRGHLRMHQAADWVRALLFAWASIL